MNDKIYRGGEITEAGTNLRPHPAFYLFLVQKDENANPVAVMSVKVSENNAVTSMPFACGAWSPIVVNSVTLTEADLQNYRVFWGE